MFIFYLLACFALVDETTSGLFIDHDDLKNISTFALGLNIVLGKFSLQACREFIFKLEPSVCGVEPFSSWRIRSWRVLTFSFHPDISCSALRFSLCFASSIFFGSARSFFFNSSSWWRRWASLASCILRAFSYSFLVRGFLQTGQK